MTILERLPLIINFLLPREQDSTRKQINCHQWNGLSLGNRTTIALDRERESTRSTSGSLRTRLENEGGIHGMIIS